MRVDLFHDRSGWIYRLDYKRLIIIALLARIIFASFYDIYCSATGSNVLLPDSKAYSTRGRYAAYVFGGYDANRFTKNLIPEDREEADIFLDLIASRRKYSTSFFDISNLYTLFIGAVYLLFGHLTIFARFINISLSICGTYFLFLVAKRRFGALTANLFLITALFLPTQFIYSLTLAKDFIPMFVVSLFVLIFDRLEAAWLKN